MTLRLVKPHTDYSSTTLTLQLNYTHYSSTTLKEFNYTLEFNWAHITI